MTAATHWQCRDRNLDLGAPVVMGVLNVTPDSFSDGGRFVERDAALRHARRMIEEGAAIIDIGGESTRPGAAPASLDEELDRVVPVIEALRRESSVFISVDTSKPEVMRAACDGWRGHHQRRARAAANPARWPRPHALGPASASCTCKASRAPCRPRRAMTTWSARSARFWLRVLPRAATAGIDAARLTIDPGFGFGKRIVDNLALLKHLGQLRELGVPLAVGLSRKSMLAKLTGRDVDDRTAGSIALAAIAVLNGARIVRAHDVAATVDAIRVAAAVAQGESFDGT